MTRRVRRVGKSRTDENDATLLISNTVRKRSPIDFMQIKRGRFYAWLYGDSMFDSNNTFMDNPVGAPVYAFCIEIKKKKPGIIVLFAEKFCISQFSIIESKNRDQFPGNIANVRVIRTCHCTEKVLE